MLNISFHHISIRASLNPPPDYRPTANFNIAFKIRYAMSSVQPTWISNNFANDMIIIYHAFRFVLVCLYLKQC